MLILSAFNITVNAKGEPSDKTSGLTFGIEWGYIASFHYGYYNYFLAPEGYRVEDKGYEFGLFSNAEMYANIGYDFNEKWNLSMYVGYLGIANFHKAVPVSLRLTRYFGKDQSDDKWFLFGDVGSGISIKISPQEIITGKIGVGYRLALSRMTSLDFIVTARMITTHPQIYHDKIPIPLEMTARNIANVSAVSFGMALNF